MEKALKISNDLSLPLETVTNTLLILARRRVGKSYTGAVMAEEMVKAGLPWVALDPTGVWWGLTSSADGKREGLPVIVIGGPHGHIPLEPSAGKVIANLVVDNPGWYVIDFSRFNNATDERRFSSDFGVQLYRRKQRQPSALHLFVDEADMFVPQKLPKDGKAMFDAFDAIVRRGGVYGLGVTLITQRPAIVNKDVTTQCETLIALQTTAPQDQDPIFDWVSRNGTDDQLKEIKRTLASLKVGQAWLFSPNSDVFEMIKIRTRETFNSSATPKPGAKPIEPKVFADINIDKLGEEIAATVERSKLEDPEYLRQQISQLRRQLSEKKSDAAPAETKIETIEVPIITDDQVKALEAALARLHDDSAKFDSFLKDLDELMFSKIDDVQKTTAALANAIADAKRHTFVGVDIARGKERTVKRPLPNREEFTKGVTFPTSESGSLPGPQQRIIDAIAWWESIGIYKPKRSIVALLAGYSSVRSKGFANPMGNLKTSGLVQYPDAKSIDLTEAGRALATPQDIPQSTEELHRIIFSRLPGPEKRILEVLIEAGGEPVDREELAARVGYTSVRSKGFANPLGRLRTIGFIDYPSTTTVVALPVLFLE